MQVIFDQIQTQTYCTGLRVIVPRHLFHVEEEELLIGLRHVLPQHPGVVVTELPLIVGEERQRGVGLFDFSIDVCQPVAHAQKKKKKKRRYNHNTSDCFNNIM